MLRQRLVPALLLVVPATTSLSASTAIVQAAEECRARPAPAAPVGTRWYYRVNRADHRRCWSLSSRAVGLHSQLSRTGSIRHRHLAGDIDAGQQDQQVDGDQQTPSAQTDHTNIALPAEQMALPQAAASLVQPSSEYLVPRSVPTITYRRPPPSAQTAARPAVSAARSAEQTSPGAGNSNIVLLAGAAAAGLLFAGGVVHFTRRVRRRSRKHAVTDRRGDRVPAVSRLSVAAKLPPMTTDPADDRRPRELRRDLKRASEARNLIPSDRKHASSSAMSLPHASAWLSRPQAEPSMKSANCCGADA